eukprot:TRINITY_DN5793_c0_g1_i1.p1 TRINITY_DN5793_c0_g1~~TRINITY_DN5793_c0_g1_i1.p1  ORF type:complete len:337 (+),score=59.58 TRINITY_DN5793_c0_g1_i1:59-1012(+)
MSFISSTMVADATTLRWIAVGVLLIVSFAGVSFPFFAKRNNHGLLDTTWFQLTRALCTGLVVGVALLHVLADAQDYLGRVSDYPVAAAGALAGIFLMVAIKEMGVMAMDYLRQEGSFQDSRDCHLEEGLLKGDEHLIGHTHTLPSVELGRIDLADKPLQRFIVYMMEMSVMVHSVLVGVALGVLQKRVAILSLGAAILFHQFFEGLALGAVAVKSEFSFASSWHLFLTFTLSCPLGGVLGIFLANSYDPTDFRTAWTLGMLNAIAAGTLLHIGLVELLPEDFREEKHQHHRQQPHPLARLLALMIGGTIMAVLAVWA